MTFLLGTGSIIGKAGSKINEIRQLSQCQIKISEPGESTPGANPSERVRFLLEAACVVSTTDSPVPSDQLVTIIGQSNNIQVAVRLLYERLEKERSKVA